MEPICDKSGSYALVLLILLSLFQLSLSAKCTPHTCGCIYDSEQRNCLKPLGRCDDSTGQINCTCLYHTTGPFCEWCEQGYYQYPNCIKMIECPHTCRNDGICDYSKGKCWCKDNFAGDFCEKCAAGYEGPLCLKVQPASSQFLTFLRAVCLLIVVGLIVATIVFAIRRKNRLDADAQRIASLMDGNDEEDPVLPIENNNEDNTVGIEEDEEKL